MRRAALVLALVAAATTASGCVGADGRRAQELLTESQAAMAKVKSYRLTGRLWMETPVGDFTFVMTGAVQMRNGGSSVMTMRAQNVPEFPGMTVVVRRDRAWVRVGRGRWEAVPLGAGQQLGADAYDFTPYVTKVDVSEGHLVGGEPAIKITGVLDTAALIESLFGQFGAVDGSALPDVADVFGDTRVVLYISETSKLAVRTLVDMTIEADGERVAIHFDLALTHVGKRVRIPKPAG